MLSGMLQLLFVEHCDAVNFDIDAGAMWRAADTGSGHFFTLHVLTKRLIEGRKIGSSSEAHTHVDDVLERRAGGLEHVEQIIKCALRLVGNVA